MVARALCVIALFTVGFAWIKPTQYEQFYANTPPGTPLSPQKNIWYDAPGLGSFNAIYRAFFWKDQRDQRSDYLDQTYYLWHEMRHLKDLDKTVAFLQDNSRPKDRLFGESDMAPILAFMSDRDLVGYMSDTNTKRVTSGQISVEMLLAQIDVPELRYIIASRYKQGRYLKINGRITDWLDANFKPVYRFSSFSDPGIQWIILERKGPRNE